MQDYCTANWQPAKGASQEVKEGDVISMRGRSRMKVEAITGTSLVKGAYRRISETIHVGN